MEIYKLPFKVILPRIGFAAAVVSLMVVRSKAMESPTAMVEPVPIVIVNTFPVLLPEFDHATLLGVPHTWLFERLSTLLILEITGAFVESEKYMVTESPFANVPLDLLETAFASLNGERG